MYYVYILSNKHYSVFYTGVTNDLERRIAEHRNKSTQGFTARYNVNKLLWYETFPTPQEAITAEKRVKDWNRSKKIALIKERNPQFIDLKEEE